MESYFAAKDDRMNESSSVQEGQMTAGSTFADSDPLNKLLLLKRPLNLEQKKLSQAKKQCRSLKESFKKIFTNDKLRYLGKETMRAYAISDSRVQESLKNRLACVSRGYEYLRDSRLPPPTERTLQKNIENITFSPGTGLLFRTKNSIK